MTVDRERLGAGWMPIWVEHEHVERWRFAAGFVDGRVVVDCACGVGRGTALLAASAAKVHAFDLDPGAVEAARATASAVNVTVELASGSALPLADGVADVFVSLETIEHVDDDRALLSEFRRVLKPGGTLICSTPNRTVTMPGRNLADTPWNPFHVREYSRNEFESLLGEFFDVGEILGQNIRTAARVSAMGFAGRVLPGHTVARINSALKLPRLVFDRDVRHRVRVVPPNHHSEYLVAVCRRS